ncbi:MAG TPA: AmpG family muropeptide MFS transporter [Stellaceae bacterium]|jgi:PAT family beta-lactamase induction signal transducer AmpG|nr:AmpG family muropeptide MFS transporter [Stellaceae bacterium]
MKSAAKSDTTGNSAAVSGRIPRRSAGAWWKSLRVYREPRLIAILLMGFSSGLPLALTFGTLSYWLAEIGVSLTAIGLFGLVRSSYSLKFLWSPLIDRLPIPFLTARLGRRRSWALTIQALLALAILALGATDPRHDPGITALAAVVVAFLSASQDIVIDAYRIELLLPEEQGAGAAATQWGYRFGLLASGAGALYAASYGGWHFAYALMAALVLVGMVTVWFTPEPDGVKPPEPLPGRGVAAHVRGWLVRAVAAPFIDLFRRNGAGQLAAIIVFIVLYKFGDALAASMSNPLYVSLGFTKVEVATIAKIYGVLATLGGVALGGILVARVGVFRALLVGGGLQALSNLLYAAQVWAGHDVAMLSLTIGGENLTGGMASSAFVAYLSGLCSREFTATQYALLSALATVGLNVLAASGGALAEALGWVPFFLLSTLFCAPALMLLLWLMHRQPAEPFQP